MESLESRRVLALAISEVHISPLFGDSDKDQFVELRGEPNQVIPSGTYFITLEGWGAVPGGPGYIHSVIDVSNITLGSNGFLTITQAGSLYSVNGQSARLKGTQVGFAGLPDNRWSDASTLSDRLAFIPNANTFLLVQAPTKPVPASDADSNDDGAFDGNAANWTVLDSVAMLNSTAGPSRSYGRITFSNSVDNIYPAGTTFVLADNGSYVGRIGASTGWAASDWVSGKTVEDDVDTSSLYRFSYGTFGDPRPLVYSGRSINSLGTFNFDGGMRGFAGVDANGDGKITAEDTPLAGVSVFADRNDNGQRDSTSVEIIASRQVLGGELANLFPNATLTIADDRNENIGFAVRTKSAFDPDFNVITVFSSEGIPWFSDSSRLKVMFYQEADSISVEAIAAESLKVSYGRIEAYDRNDNLISFVQSGPLLGTARETISISRPMADIKYAVIYTNDRMQNSSPFGPFDKLRYTYPEFQSISDETGLFAIQELPKGPYRLGVSGYPGDKIPLDSNLGGGIVIQNTEHLLGVNYGYRPNELPVIQTGQLLVTENPNFNAVVGKILASDTDIGQVLSYRFLGASGPFSLNPTNGDVTFNNTAKWDFETNTPIVVDVEVSDSLTIPGKTVRSLTIVPIDVNEPPVIPPTSFAISENSPIGTVVGTVLASDADAGAAGQFAFSLGPTNPANIFAIHPSTGVITVVSSAALDFEARNTILLPVVATDQGNPVQAATRTVTISLADVNEPPSGILFANVISLPESASNLSPTNVAIIQVIDDAIGSSTLSLSGPDAGSFSIVNQTLRLNAGVALDFETKPNYVVVVSADDPNLGSNPDVSATFTLQITDVNEPPRGIQFTSLFNPVPETTVVSTAIPVANVSALDDPLGSNTISLVAGLDSANFQLVGSELRFRSTTPLDFETKASYRVVLQVDDPTVGGNPDALTTFTLSIGNVNEAPTDVRFSSAVSQLAETNQTSQGQAVANILITDDGIGTNTTTLVGADASAFEVVDGQLRLKTGTLLDFEAKPFYQVTVRVSDATIAGSTPVERPYRLNIVNRPEVVSLTDASGGAIQYPAKTFRFTWDMELADVASDAIRVIKKDSANQEVAIQWQSSLVGDVTVVDGQFTGASVGPNGLVDGVYEILVDGQKTTTFTAAAGLSFSSGNIDVFQPPLIAALQLTGPSLIRVGSPVSYQWSLSGLPDPQPTSVEYAIDLDGDGTVDRTVTGGLIASIPSLVYATASVNTLIVTAKVGGSVVASNALVVNVSPETNADETWLSALDTDRDANVSPLDVLAVINRINSGSGGSIAYALNLDADRDGSISPLDVLSVINHINTPVNNRPVTFSNLFMAESGGLPGITNDLSIAGNISDGSTELLVALNGGPKRDASRFIDSNGRFSITDTAIAELFGNIPDGAHTFSLFARKAGSISAAVDKRFLSLKNHLQPFSISTSSVSNGTARIAWNRSASGAAYDVWLSTNGNAPVKVRSGLAVTQVALPLAAGNYRIYIEATDAAGNRLATPNVDFTV
ncbi:MAG: cadherin domain-containing protein [Pirellula sp.]